MAIRNLEKIFKPKRIAVIGASTTPHSVGNTVVVNLKEAGFAGSIYPINPKYSTIAGLKAYGSVGEPPELADLAIICTPGPTVPNVVDECGRCGIRGLVILSAGFREVGDAGRLLEEELLRTAAKYDGMRIIGPNCL